MGLFLDDYLSNTSCFAEGNLLYIIYPFMPFGFYSMHCIIVRKKKKKRENENKPSNQNARMLFQELIK